MSKSNLYLQITNGIWLIEPSAIHQFGPIVKSLLEKGIDIDTEVKTPSVMLIDAMGAITFAGRYSSFNEAQPQSTAVIKISGAIMKQDNCGDPGSSSIGSLIKQADSHPNISSIVLMIDSPGGTVAGTEDLSAIVKNASKPVVAYVDGTMASAAYWIGCSAKEIYSGNKTDQIGSIGTMCSFADAQAMWEKQGVVFHEIYATASKDKNKDYHEARKGNYDLIIQRLDSINQIFTSSVKANRGDKLNQKETLSGKVFMAEDAVTMGLIDGIKSFEEVVARAQELASVSPINNNNNQNQQSNMKIKAGLTEMVAFLASAFSGFKAEETVLTEEHLEKMNAELATLEAVKAELATANDAKTKAASDLVTANVTMTENATKITGLEAKVAELGKVNPGSTETKKEGDDQTGNSAKSETQKMIDELPHNASIDNDPRFNGSLKK